MKRHRSGTKSIFVLASLIAGLSLTGCGMTQGNLRASTVPANTSAPFTVRSSSVSVDTTAPEIEALNVTIPYGTSLRPEEIASITDDQDASPTLEIASVVDITDRAGQNTASSGSTETAAVAVSAEVAPAAANEVASAAASEIASVTDTEETEVTAESGATIETAAATETAAVSVTSETAAEVEPADPGYLFSTPGKYNMTLKGTDKSGNESTKTIVVTVTDNFAPVFDGLREGFEITDKDKGIVTDMIEQTINLEKIYIDKDPYNTSDRIVLDLGHTIGHALEKAKNYTMTQGECIALGIIAAAHISLKRQMLSLDEYLEIRDMLSLFVKSDEPSDIDKVINDIRLDMCSNDKGAYIILLKKIGKAVPDYDVTDEELREALKELLFTEDDMKE